MAGESALEIVLESLFTHYYLGQKCVQHSEFVKPYSRGKYCLTFLLSSVYHLVRKWLSIVKFLFFISIVHKKKTFIYHIHISLASLKVIHLSGEVNLCVCYAAVLSFESTLSQ